MPIAVLCPNCSAKLNAPDAAAGKRLKCPKCASVISVPAAVVEYEVVGDDPPPTPARQNPQPAGEGDTARPPASAKRTTAPVEVNEAVEKDGAATPRTRRGRESGDVDETPRTKGEGKKSKGSLPILLGVGGGVVAVLALVGVIVGMALGGGESPAKGTTQPDGSPTVPPPVPTPVTPANATGASPNWQPPPPADLSLKESAEFANVTSPATPLPPVLFVEEVDPYGNNRPTTGTGLLRQELFRQAVMVAARDDLSLTTRDASLGEMPPDGLPDVARVRVHVRSIPLQVPRSVRVEAASGDKFRPVWAAESGLGYPESILQALSRADELARGGYLTALKRVGGWAPAPKKVSDQPFPRGVEPALAHPTVVSQMYAVRTLHAHMREVGESPAALAALSCGYANLGVLTDRLWDGTTWVFKARSLLYAERLRHLDESAAAGLWSRGYALALAGRHADALADFAAAEKVAGKNAQPEWVPLAVAVCKFDSASLRAKTENHPLADWALLCLYLTQEEWEFPSACVAIGEELLKRVPECHRVSESLARLKGLGTSRHHSQAGLDALKTAYRDELDRVSGLPRPVSGLIQDHAELEELLLALAASGRDAKDRGELSWAVLGHVITESRLTLIESRMSFLRYVLSVPTDDYTEQVRPLVRDHPLSPVLSVYGFDADRQRDKAQQALRQAPVNWYTAREEGRTIHRHYLTAADNNAMHNLAVVHGDGLYTDQFLMIQPMTNGAEAMPYVDMLMENSPYSPTARARHILADTPKAKQSVGQWKKDCQHGIVSVALAKKAFIDKNYAEAEQLYEWALTFTKEYAVYRQLSDLYLNRGEEEKWLLTLQQSLDVPVSGLEHAQARVRIANHYLAKEDFANARKYADRAAETGAAWAMLTAATCAEADDDLPAAEKWVASTSQRYDDDARLWYFWCLRTGQGDVEQARQVVDAHLKQVGPPKLAPDRMAAAIVHAADGRPKDAAIQLEACFNGRNHVMLMLAATLYDQAGDAKDRDRLLAALPVMHPYAPLLQLFRDTLKKGEKVVPSKDELTAVWKALPEVEQVTTGYLLGSFLHTRGENALAKPYMERSIKRAAHGAIPPTLAGLALHAK